ncbi:MAG: hypothetical protein J2P25_10390 [Nocardiopsaceae bacterium]|nr:hypothetical protein [Nocardiopsaceae bacterium]
MPWFRRASPSPEDQFAREVIALAREIGGPKVRRLDGFALRIEWPGGGPVTMNLQNIYAEARQLDGDERAEYLRRAVLGMAPHDRPAEWNVAAPLLLPAVRSVSWSNAASVGAEPGASAPIPFGKPLAPFIKVACAIDFEHSMTFATPEDLAAWGVTDDEALRTATANLARMPMEVSRAGPTAMVRGPDGYASSWLAVPAMLSRIPGGFGGSVIALAPTRDLLVLADTDDSEATVRVLDLALEGYQEAPRQLSPVPYLISETGIEPWAPPPGHPARSAAARAARDLAAAEYGQQTAMLGELFAKTGEDVHVANYMLMHEEDGSSWSWAAWNRQVANGLLPRADMLIIGDNDDPDAMITVRWEDALRAAGHVLREEPAYDPPRWRYRGGLDGDTLASLRAHAVPLRRLG